MTTMRNDINSNSQPNLTDYLIAFTFCIIFTIVCAMFSSRVLHWFIFPLIPCGVLIGVDAVGWFRGKYDLFDPKALLGLLGLHFFFVSQLLVIVWDIHTMKTAVLLDDYRPWIGLLSIFNAIGLIIYRVVEKAVSCRQYNHSTARVWIADGSRWGLILAISIIIAFGAQAYLVFKLGYVGRISYDIYERWEVKGGTGVFRLLGKSAPIFLMIFLTLIRSKTAKRESGALLTYILMGFMVVVTLLCGGMVGSRGATVWNMFWIVGIAHFFWKRFTVKEAVLGLCALIMFMNIYGFFKHLGIEGLQILKSEGWAVAAQESGISTKGILVGDLSRSDVNAYMAYVLVKKPYDYDYRWGKTIWGDILLQFPIWIYPNHYNRLGAGGKMIAGTDIMMGRGYLKPNDPFTRSRYVYGLTGQVMLNFGILPIPLAFILLGYCVGRFRRAFLNWKPYDMRLFITPVIIYLLIMLLTNDFNNQINGVIFMFSLPFAAVWLISQKLSRDEVDQLEISDEFESQDYETY